MHVYVAAKKANRVGKKIFGGRGTAGQDQSLSLATCMSTKDNKPGGHGKLCQHINTMVQRKSFDAKSHVGFEELLVDLLRRL